MTDARRPVGLRLTTRLRMTLVYTGISILSVVAIFALTFLSLYRTLQQDDLREIQGRLLGYWAQYQTGGLDLLQDEIGVDNLVVGERPFFVRVADRDNATVFYSYPRIWEPFDITDLEQMSLEPTALHVLTSDAHEYRLEVAGLWLSEEYFLQLGMSDQNRARLLALFQRNFLVIAVVVVGIGFFVGLVTATRALRPIARVTGVARQIVDTGRLDARVEQGTGGGELTQLVEVINAMLDRIERLVDGMRNTVDMVAHDLRTPITRLRARAELALRDGSTAETETALVETVEQSDEILLLVNTLLDITEAESGVMKLAPEELAVGTLAAEVADLYELVAEERGIEMRVDVPADLVARVDRLRFRRVLGNLVDNAVKYCREGGLVTITAHRVGSPAGSGAEPDTGGRGGNPLHQVGDGHPGAIDDRNEGMVEISVADTGPGLSLEEQERVWERMYRGPIQPEERGLGLGLSLVRAVVEAHGGTVGVDSMPGSGCRFIVRVPG